ncbi:MAG: TOBE domain-containing protein [Acidimicrobiales bacterium]
MADFIGRTNLLDATVAGTGEVALVNGDRLRLPTLSADPGTPVGVAIRPERLDLTSAGDPAPGSLQLKGRVERTTYVGHAIVYGISVEWMELEARLSNPDASHRFSVGDDVTVSFSPEHASVLVD